MMQKKKQQQRQHIQAIGAVWVMLKRRKQWEHHHCVLNKKIENKEGKLEYVMEIMTKVWQGKTYLYANYMYLLYLQTTTLICFSLFKKKKNKEKHWIWKYP